VVYNSRPAVWFLANSNGSRKYEKDNSDHQDWIIRLDSYAIRTQECNEYIHSNYVRGL